MNKDDLERMISLTDDRYINELFSDRISMSRRNHFLKFACCAASLIAVIVGINALVDNSGIDITDLNQIRTEITLTESAMPYSGINGEDDTDYSKYFKSGYFTNDEYYDFSEIGGRTYDFPIPYIQEIVPFADLFDEGFGNFRAACDKDGNAVKIYGSYCDLSGYHRVTVNMSSSERIVSNISGKAVERFGADIYGCEYGDDLNNGLALYFYTEGTAYYLTYSLDFDYKQAIEVMDSIILSGFSIEDFDLSQGIKSNFNGGRISFAEAKEIEAFKGFLPQTETVDFGNGTENYLNLSYSYIYQGDTLVKQMLDIHYQEPIPNIENFTEYESVQYIDLDYRSDKSTMFPDAIPIGELTREKVDDLKSYRQNIIGIYSGYYFQIEFDNFYIDVSTNCSLETLWSVLGTIPKE